MVRAKKEPLSNKPLLFMILFASVAPDLDFLLVPIARLFPSLDFLDHRRFFHTFWGAPLYAYLMYKISEILLNDYYYKEEEKKLDLVFGKFEVMWLVASSWSHVIIDSLTNTGIALWSPFSKKRVVFGLVSWGNALFNIATIIGSGLLYYYRSSHKKIYYISVFLVFIGIVTFIPPLFLGPYVVSYVESLDVSGDSTLYPMATQQIHKWYVYWESSFQGIDFFRAVYVNIFDLKYKNVTYYSFARYKIDGVPVAKDNELLQFLLKHVENNTYIQQNNEHGFFLSYNFVAQREDENGIIYKVKITMPRTVLAWGYNRNISRYIPEIRVPKN